MRFKYQERLPDYRERVERAERAWAAAKAYPALRQQQIRARNRELQSLASAFVLSHRVDFPLEYR